jgi:hypothetical protein
LKSWYYNSHRRIRTQGWLGWFKDEQVEENLGNDEYVSGPDGGSDMIYAYHKTY